MNTDEPNQSWIGGLGGGGNTLYNLYTLNILYTLYTLCTLYALYSLYTLHIVHTREKGKLTEPKKGKENVRRDQKEKGKMVARPFAIQFH